MGKSENTKATESEPRYCSTLRETHAVPWLLAAGVATLFVSVLSVTALLGIRLP